MGACCGRRNRWTGRSCTPTRSGRCRSGTGPAAPPLRWSMHSADQRDGRSHCAAIDKPTRSARSRPPPRLADLLLQLPGAPGLIGGGAGPVAGDRPEPPAGSRPRRVPGPAPSPLRPRAANTPRAGPGRARAPRRQPDRTSSELIGALPGCGHDPHPSMDSDPPPHPGRSRHPLNNLRCSGCPGACVLELGFCTPGSGKFPGGFVRGSGLGLWSWLWWGWGC